MATGDCEYQVLPIAGRSQGNMEYEVCVAGGLLGSTRRFWVKVAGEWKQVMHTWVKVSGSWVETPTPSAKVGGVWV